MLVVILLHLQIATPIKAPSAIPSPLTRVMPKELTVEEIKGIIKHFGEAALRAKQAGYDVIEVIGSAGLFNQPILLTGH